MEQESLDGNAQKNDRRVQSVPEQASVVVVESHTPPQPKTKNLLKRILTNHDLDELLVYQKRHRSNIPATQYQPPKFKNVQKEEKVAQIKAEKIKQQSKLVETIQARRIKNTKEKQKDKPQEKLQQVVEISQEPPKNKSQIANQTQTAVKLTSHQSPVEVPPKIATEQVKSVKEAREPSEQKKEQQSNEAGKKRVKRPRPVVYTSDSDDQHQKAVFPIANHISGQSQQLYLEHLSLMDELKLQRRKEGRILGSDTYISCDVKYFNWDFFVDKVGTFEVVLIDPPWRIKGAQQNDSQFMFSNCKFNLEYNTMSNKEISKIGVDRLSDCGFIFLWILNTQMDSSIQIMNRWGYQLVDSCIWVKLKDQKVYLTHGYYFMHSYEVCLIGYKKHPTKTIEVNANFCSNILISEVRKKSQKPDELYQLIELMIPKSKKIEIYARNNNLRVGWFSLGNQLGESYDKWLLRLHCDDCQRALQPNSKRYKSKTVANYDLCELCILNNNKENFFEILNQTDQDIIHLYRSCNHCGIQPIWGTRFECTECSNFDLCQNCFDLNLSSQQPFHPKTHKVNIVEVPIFGHGFNIHDFKCCACFQKPIIGICFACKVCRNYNLCQKCFFQRNDERKSNNMRTHRPEHEIEAIFDPNARPIEKKFECFGCNKRIEENCWMCQNCYNFYFCQKCYEQRLEFKTQMANSHKNYHHFAHIF